VSGLNQEQRLLWAGRLRGFSQETRSPFVRHGLHQLAALLEAARDLPTDVLRLAAEHSGELAESVRVHHQEERADAIDIYAEYAQKTADGEPADWPPVLEDLAAREMKWRGLEPGA
jgi:hypothetical protein